MFRYYRTPGEARQLMRSSPEAIKSIDEAKRFIEARHQVKLLGHLVSVSEMYIHFRQPNSVAVRRMFLSSKVMLWLINDGVFEDSWVKHERILLFGSIEDSRWINCIALREDSLNVVYDAGATQPKVGRKIGLKGEPCTTVPASRSRSFSATSTSSRRA